MVNSMLFKGITGLNCRNGKSVFIMETKSRVLFPFYERNFITGNSCFVSDVFYAEKKEMTR